MSKTPRTDELAKKYIGATPTFAEPLEFMNLCEQLETELADMRKQFAEYVQAEESWRNERTDDRIKDALRVKASELSVKAFQTLRR